MDRARVVMIVQLIAFILHFIMAIVVVSVSFQCRSERYTNKGMRMLPMQCPANQTSSLCFRDALPWADDEPLKNHAWNPFMMVVVFEFISAGFALFYLREQRQWPAAFQLFCRYYLYLLVICFMRLNYSTGISRWPGSAWASYCTSRGSSSADRPTGRRCWSYPSPF